MQEYLYVVLVYLPFPLSFPENNLGFVLCFLFLILPQILNEEKAKSVFLFLCAILSSLKIPRISKEMDG